MFTGVYICGSVFVYLLALLGLILVTNAKVPVRRLRKRLSTFSLLSFLLSFSGLLVFMVLSGAAGIVRLGQTQNFSLPQDYIEYGLVGWGILAVGMLGLLAPLLVAPIVAYRH